jgi:hypothetical protein
VQQRSTAGPGAAAGEGAGRTRLVFDLCGEREREFFVKESQRIPELKKTIKDRKAQGNTLKTSFEEEKIALQREVQEVERQTASEVRGGERRALTLRVCACSRSSSLRLSERWRARQRARRRQRTQRESSRASHRLGASVRTCW